MKISSNALCLNVIDCYQIDCKTIFENKKHYVYAVRFDVTRWLYKLHMKEKDFNKIGMWDETFYFLNWRGFKIIN